jgi:hypothetical protein
VNPRIRPACFPTVQVGLCLLQAFEAETFQGCLLGVPDPGLDLSFASWILDSARHGHRAVVREHVTIKRIEGGIVNIGNEYAFAQVVKHHDACTSTQPAKRFLVKFGPDARTGMKHE